MTKLKQIFKSSSADRKHRMLEMTDNTSLKLFWMRTQNKAEVIMMLRGLDLRATLNLLSICFDKIKDNLTKQLRGAGHKGFNTNEQIAMKFFDLEVLRKNSDNKIEKEQ